VAFDLTSDFFFHLPFSDALDQSIPAWINMSSACALNVHTKTIKSLFSAMIGNSIAP
jgi:hypothetical protein